jgi:glyoxylase-like metal-dependent hydrolase (beta-lactamase superfamily II)
LQLSFVLFVIFVVNIFPMRIHHMTVGYFRPPLRLLTQGGIGNPFRRGEYVIHCLLLDMDDRLILVDSGLGRADMERPLSRLGWGMSWFGGASAGSTASEQIAALRDVGAIKADLPISDIIMTHLDGDHTGGLSDFPDARVHLNGMELEAWRRGPGPAGKQRYVNAHFAHGPRWQKYRDFPQDWFGFPATKLVDLPEALRLIQLPGHTLGHCGVAIEQDGKWLLHCADTTYHSAWFNGRKPPVAIQITERLLAQDWRSWNETRRKVAVLQQTGEVTVFGSHDPEMFAKLSARPPD